MFMHSTLQSNCVMCPTSVAEMVKRAEMTHMISTYKGFMQQIKDTMNSQSRTLLYYI